MLETSAGAGTPAAEVDIVERKKNTPVNTERTPRDRTDLNIRPPELADRKFLLKHALLTFELCSVPAKESD
jgi:hypothetical protein